MTARKKDVGQVGNGGQFARRTLIDGLVSLTGTDSTGSGAFPSQEVREALSNFLDANDSHASAKTLLKLSGHRSDTIRLSVASNPKADIATVYALSRDLDPSVAAAARAHRNYRPHTVADRLRRAADKTIWHRAAA